MARLLLAALCGGFFICNSAWAETVCALRAAIVPSLEAEYGEIAVGGGLLPDGRLLELFVSATGTFTVVATNPQGLSCVVAVGTDWEVPVSPGTHTRPSTRAGP